MSENVGQIIEASRVPPGSTFYRGESGAPDTTVCYRRLAETTDEGLTAQAGCIIAWEIVKDGNDHRVDRADVPGCESVWLKND